MVLAALVVTRVVTSAAPDRPIVTPTSASAVASVVLPNDAPRPDALPSAALELPCEDAACDTHFSVPAAATAAVQAAFPGAEIADAGESIATPADRLAYRIISAAVGDTQIVVTVRGPDPSDQLGVLKSRAIAPGEARTVTSLAVRAGRLTVLVEVSSPSARPATAAAVRRLATDRRLLVDI